MRPIICAVLALLCFAAPASAGTCAYTKTKFLEDARVTEMQVWSVSSRATAAIIAKVNEVRAARGAKAWETHEVMFGLFTHNGQLLAAVMFFKDGCSIPTSTLIMPASYWAQAMAALGLTDDDFKVLQGA